jgi:hypothetical protein
LRGAGPGGKFVTRLFWGVSATIIVLAGLFWALRDIDNWEVAFYVVIGIIPGASWEWHIRRTGNGFVELFVDGFMVNTKASKHRYRWIDIERIEASPWAEDRTSRTLYGLIIGRDTERVVVKVKLRRSPRQAVFGHDSGTDIEGIPNPFLRTVAWDLENPHDFVRLVQPFLRPTSD